MRFVCVVSLETFAKDQSGGESMRCKAKSTEGKDPFRLRQSGHRPLRAWLERALLAFGRSAQSTSLAAGVPQSKSVDANEFHRKTETTICHYCPRRGPLRVLSTTNQPTNNNKPR